MFDVTGRKGVRKRVRILHTPFSVIIQRQKWDLVFNFYTRIPHPTQNKTKNLEQRSLWGQKNKEYHGGKLYPTALDKTWS